MRIIFLIAGLSTIAYAAPKSTTKMSMIVNGVIVTPTPMQKLSFVASLQDTPGHSFCGGSLYGDQKDMVITAAHCMQDLTTSDVAAMIVSVGRLDLRLSADDQRGIDYRIVAYQCHTLYNTLTHENDICLLRVAPISNVSVNALVTAIPLDQSNAGMNNRTKEKLWKELVQDTKGIDATNGLNAMTLQVAGWGVSDVNSIDPSPVCRVTDLLIARTESCQRVLETSLPSDTIVCAMSKSGISDSCHGDSGGPLFSISPKNEYALVGLVSFGTSCARLREAFLVVPTQYPAIHTRVFYYRQWIQDTVAKLRLVTVK